MRPKLSGPALTGAIAVGLFAATLAAIPDGRIQLATAAAACLAILAFWTLLRPGRWITTLLAAALLLPPLPVVIGGTGPHVAILFAAIGLALGLVHLADWRLPSGAGWPLAALLGALVFSLAPAALFSGPRIAAASLARVSLFGIAVYLYFYLTCGPGHALDVFTPRHARLLFLAGVATALFACVDFHFQFPAPAGYGPQFVWLASGVYRRAQGVFYEASTLGNLCAFFLLMVAACLFRPHLPRPAGRAVLITGGAVLLAALVLSYSRASLISVCVGLAALGWLRSGGRSVRLVAAGGAVLLLAAAAALTLFPAFLRLYWERLLASASYFFEAPGAVLSGRLDSWSALLAFVAAHPWHLLAGVGYKTLPYSSFTGRAIVPDNMYLSLLVETGIFGLAALVWFHAAAIRVAWRAAGSAHPNTAFFGTWFFCFWCGETVQMLSGDLLTYWRVLPVYLWVLAAAARGARERSLS